MARLVANVVTLWSAQAAFDFLADFSTTKQWDPAVTDAKRLDDGPLGKGSRFSVVTGFLGASVALDYEITEYEPPHFFALRGESPTVVSVDEITIAPRADGARVIYDAKLELKSVLWVFDPALQWAFDRIGGQSVEGLRAALDAAPPRTRAAS